MALASEEYFPRDGQVAASRDAVRQCVVEAGQLLTQGTTARAAEAKVDEAASFDGQSVAAGCADAIAAASDTLGSMPVHAAQSPEHAHLWSSLQLAGIVSGRTILRDWASLWSTTSGGDDGDAVKRFVERFLMERAHLLSQRQGQPCLGQLADVWAVLMKLRAGTATNVGDTGRADELMAEVEGALAALAGAAEGQDPAVVCVSRMVVLRTVEEFGLFNRRSQRRGLPLNTHDDLRVRFHTAILPKLWVSCVTDFLTFAGNSWGTAPEPFDASVTGPISAPHQVMLLRVIHAMLNWRFIRPVSHTGTEMGTLHVDGAPGMLPIVRGADWKVGLEASVQGTTLVNAIAAMVTEAALRERPGSLADGTAVVSVGPFTALNTMATEELGTLASEAFCQLCAVFGSDEEGWTPTDRAAYGMMLAEQAFAIAGKVMNTAADNADHGAVLRTACSSIERIIASVGTTDGLFYSPDLNAFHEQLAGMTEAVVAVSSRFLDNYSDDASEEEQNVSEALERLLRAWTMLLNSAFGDSTTRCKLDQANASEPLADAASRVFRCYVSSKVTAQLQGTTRSAVSGGSAGTGGGEEAAAEGGMAGHAAEYIASHLQAIGQLARERPTDSAAFLMQAMSAVVERLQQSVPQSLGGAAPDGAMLQPPSPNVCEALWYLMRIIGHFIADDDESERPCIPATICAHAVRAEAALVLESGDPVLSEDAGARAEHLVANDSFFSLLQGMFAFANSMQNFVQHCLSNALEVALPPSVLEALVFVLHRFAATYLAPDEDTQADFTEAFHNVFECGVFAAETCIQFLATGLAAYPAEPACVAECVNAFKAMVDKAALSSWLLDRPEVHTFLSVGIGSGHFQLPSQSRGALIGLLASLAAQASNDAEDGGAAVAAAYGGRTIAPVSLATPRVLQFNGNQQGGMTLIDVLRADVVEAKASAQMNFTSVIGSADTIRGMLRHLQSPSVVGEVCESLLPALTDFGDVVAAGSPFGHHLPLNVAVLEVLDTIVDSCSTFLPTPIMDAVVGIMEVVVVAAVERIKENFASAASRAAGSSSALDSQAEDERCELLIRCTRLLLSCATWGAFDLSSVDTSAEDDAVRLQRISHFCVSGLIELLSIVWGSPDVLNIPAVGGPLYKLLREVSDTHTDTLLSLPSAEQADAMLWFIRTAVTVADVDLNLSAFGIITALANHSNRAHQAGNASGMEARLGEFVDDLWAAFATCAVDVAAVSAFAGAVRALGGALGGEPVYESWRQAMLQKQQAVSPDSPAGQHVDRIIRGAMANTNFAERQARSSLAFASELASALAVLRGAAVTL